MTDTSSHQSHQNDENLSTAQLSEKWLEARRRRLNKGVPRNKLTASYEAEDFLAQAIVRAEKWLEQEQDITKAADLRLLIGTLKAEHRRVVRLHCELKGQEGA